MPQIVEPTEPDAQRAVIRLVLDEIATEVETALREAHLDFPVFLTVPNSGESLATMACPLDPSDADCTCFSDCLKVSVIIDPAHDPHDAVRYVIRTFLLFRTRGYWTITEKEDFDGRD